MCRFVCFVGNIVSEFFTTKFTNYTKFNTRLAKRTGGGTQHADDTEEQSTLFVVELAAPGQARQRL